MMMMKKGLWMLIKLKRDRAKSLSRINQLHHGYITKTWRVTDPPYGVLCDFCFLHLLL